MTFVEWLKNRNLKEQDYKTFDLEKQAAMASELAKAGNKPNSAAIARQVITNPKVVKAAVGLTGLKPDEMKIKADIDRTIKTQQQQAKRPPQFGVGR
jgi:uncharacterized protein (DUF362 family)